MIEKVNPSHPDKIADRVAGAIVDLAYTKQKQPKVAVEILVGHGNCHIIVETSVDFTESDIQPIVKRIAGDVKLNLKVVPQDAHLSTNQEEAIRCGDNGIFKGVPLTSEEKELSALAREIYKEFPTDGKYILDNEKLTICQSHAKDIRTYGYNDVIINPLGNWTGGTDVDTGATNRKLGSDMAQSVTGGGIHGKDLSKADVSVNIYAFLKAQEENKTIEFSCSIGDEHVNGIPYKDIVEIADEYISDLGGFEKLAEWGLF